MLQDVLSDNSNTVLTHHSNHGRSNKHRGSAWTINIAAGDENVWLIKELPSHDRFVKVVLDVANTMTGLDILHDQLLARHAAVERIRQEQAARSRGYHVSGQAQRDGVLLERARNQDREQREKVFASSSWDSPYESIENFNGHMGGGSGAEGRYFMQDVATGSWGARVREDGGYEFEEQGDLVPEDYKQVGLDTLPGRTVTKDAESMIQGDAGGLSDLSGPSALMLARRIRDNVEGLIGAHRSAQRKPGRSVLDPARSPSSSPLSSPPSVLDTPRALMSRSGQPNSKTSSTQRDVMRNPGDPINFVSDDDNIVVAQQTRSGRPSGGRTATQLNIEGDRLDPRNITSSDDEVEVYDADGKTWELQGDEDPAWLVGGTRWVSRAGRSSG